MNQKGITQIFVILILLGGLLGGLYLVQNPQIFRSRAAISNPTAEFVDAGGNPITQTADSSVKLKITRNLAGTAANVPTAPSPTPTPGFSNSNLLMVNFIHPGTGVGLRVAMSDPQAKKDVIDLYYGRNSKRIPDGTIVDDRPRKSPYDSQWSWHFNPATIQMAEVTVEVCDASPQYIEEHLDEWLKPPLYGNYCPWGLELKSIEGISPPSSTPTICAAVITPAKDSNTGECKEFPTPCDVPKGWVVVKSC